MFAVLNYHLKSFSGFILKFFYFPVWWYSFSLFMFFKRNFEFLSRYEEGLALFAWVKNIFKPLFKDYSAWGIFLSFWVRLVQIAWRGSVFLILCCWVLLKMMVWTLLPIATVYYIIANL